MVSSITTCLNVFESLSEGFSQDARFRTKAGKDASTNQYDYTYLMGNSDNFNIIIDLDDKVEEDRLERIKNSIYTFKLEDIYKTHKDYVQEIIQKIRIYNNSFIKELLTNYPELFTTEQDVLNIVMANYLDDGNLDKRPLSKLIKDIFEEFKIGSESQI